MNRPKSQSKGIDTPLLIGVLLLVGFGLVMVYSASFYKLMVKDGLSPESYLVSGIGYAAFGVIIMFVLSFIDYKIIRKLTVVVVGVAFFLGILVLVKGDYINGSKRWINIMGISIMPSELIKVAILMSTATYCAGKGRHMAKAQNFLAAVLFIGALSSLVMLQPNLSTTALAFLLGLSILFLSDCRLHHFGLLMGSAVGAFVLLILVAPYRLQRIIIYLASYMDRTYIFDDTRRQIMYSIYAIGSGGLTGVGLGMGELKNLRLPEPYNDFIFSIVAEELGLLGALFLLLLFCFVIYRIFWIASLARDQYAFLMASGTGLLISFQLIINVGVATNLFPTTGIPLPFVSKGGSSLLIMMGLIGIVLNISSNLKDPKRVFIEKDKVEESA